MKRIGIYGGTFDPIHFGHIKAAENVLKTVKLDFIIIVPAGMPPHKDGGYRKMAEDRLAMCRLAAADNPKLRVSDYEIRHEGKSYTYKTLGYFKKKFINDRLFFILGDEAYKSFDTWKNPETIKSLAELVVVKRTGEKIDENGVIMINKPPFQVSSSEIREKAAKGESLSGLVPGEVLNYIYKNNLYRSENTK